MTDAAFPIQRLKKRAEFLAAAKARAVPRGAVLVQARDRADGTDLVRLGFTATKRIGGAVVRNRAKRRLREVARLILPELGRPGWDYVLIGRPQATASRPFDALQDDLRYALRKLHGDSP